MRTRAAARSPRRGRRSKARETARGEIDALAARLVDAGLASWAGAGRRASSLSCAARPISSGFNEAQDLERIRLLFADLETQTDVIDLLHRAENGDGVKIFIGSENKLFSLSGSSMIAAPLRGTDQRIAGVLGVIGPTRLNYGRIVPMVEYAAQMLGDLKRYGRRCDNARPEACSAPANDGRRPSLRSGETLPLRLGMLTRLVNLE